MLEFFEVRRIHDGRVMYNGHSIASAARQLSPGRCYGAGKSPQQATDACRCQYQGFKRVKLGLDK